MSTEETKQSKKAFRDSQDTVDDHASSDSSDDGDDEDLKALAANWAAAAASTNRHVEEKDTPDQKTAASKFPSIPKNANTEYSLYLSQLPFDCGEWEIRQFFVQHAGCTFSALRMVYDQGVFRGVAFGECSNAAQYQAALQLHRSKHTLKGRRINVRPTKTKQELGDIVKRREDLVAAKVALLRQRQKDKKNNAASKSKTKKKKGRVHKKKSSAKTKPPPTATSASSSPPHKTGNKNTSPQSGTKMETDGNRGPSPGGKRRKRQNVTTLTTMAVATKEPNEDDKNDILVETDIMKTNGNDSNDNSTLQQETTSFRSKPSQSLASIFGGFDLSPALFCGGLAFDAYVEPPSNSSRWERGSQGLNVAFVSSAFTRQLYKGVVEIKVAKCSGLPQDESGTERLLTGDGVDACVMVAAVEGSWEQDVELLEKQQYHEGVWDLSGAAHVGRTSTAWANVDEKKSQQSKRQRGKASPYHIPGGWGRGGQAIWPEEEPFYLYVQDPSKVRLVVTVLDDDRVGRGTPVGSTYKRLSNLIPQAGLSSDDLIKSMKLELVEAAKKGEIDLLDENTQIRMGAKSWQGTLKLTSKPRKKDKNSQILTGAAAGAYVAGPVGAAAGAFLGSIYESQVQGSVDVKIRYLPIPPAPVNRKRYEVMGGMPGIDWGTLFRKYIDKTGRKDDELFDFNDLEHCFFVNHERTGATCSVYRSLKKKVIAVSFRGTCTPVDLITDASLVQDAWVEGEDVANQDIPKVHNGFRASLNSISRRLKELVLATVAPGDSIADYDMIVTGHSLGGALATLFTADIGQYGIDGGRGLPQLLESEPWWKGIADFVVGAKEGGEEFVSEPPRPKSLRLYNFGSPRVGNDAFADLFDALVGEGMIDQAYRVVNGEDVVARMPRTFNALALGQVRYEHVGTTVLVTQPVDTDSDVAPVMESLVWVEGESDDRLCPVRDGISMASETGESSLVTELVEATKESWEKETSGSITGRLSAALNQVTTRLKTVTAQDVASIVGIDRSFSEREIKLAQALLQGKALAHHMENEYYAAVGRASGFLAMVGEEVIPLEKPKSAQ